jgi:hypothetical protein
VYEDGTELSNRLNEAHGSSMELLLRDIDRKFSKYKSR